VKYLLEVEMISEPYVNIKKLIDSLFLL